MAALHEYECPCCGGSIEFNSSIQKMKCPFCDTEFEMEALKQFDEQLKGDPGDDLNWDTGSESEWATDAEGMKVYVCKSCGGEIVTDETTSATSCPYCDNPVVMMNNFSSMLKPDLVIPFKLDKKAATDGLKKHLMGKKLLPKVFTAQNHIDEVKGVYVPFWLFDAGADANIRYKATKKKRWSDSRFNYTETSFYSVLRAGNIAFEQVPVDGSTKMEDDLMESLEPFDMSQAVDFQTAYLAGYLADKYDVSKEDSIERANERIKKSTEIEFANTVTGFDSVTAENTSVRLQSGKVTYALLPVWILNTTWNGQKYTFAMNGQTGKFVGDLPMDKSAYTRWLLGLTAGIAAGVYLASYLMWLL